jgi:hypothetical protein
MQKIVLSLTNDHKGGAIVRLVIKSLLATMLGAGGFHHRIQLGPNLAGATFASIIHELNFTCS